MKRKRVFRYYCDYCKKSNCSAPAIRKHELHCTMNPNRKCGMCERNGNDQAPLRKMVQLLPNPTVHTVKSEYGVYLDAGFDKALKPALVALRKEADDCPACILAAIRQARIPVPAVHTFDFKAECETFWHDINEQERERDENELIS